MGTCAMFKTHSLIHNCTQSSVSNNYDDCWHFTRDVCFFSHMLFSFAINKHLERFSRLTEQSESCEIMRNCSSVLLSWGGISYVNKLHANEIDERINRRRKRRMSIFKVQHWVIANYRLLNSPCVVVGLLFFIIHMHDARTSYIVHSWAHLAGLNYIPYLLILCRCHIDLTKKIR